MPKRIAVVGLGYVGLPLLLHSVAKGFESFGIDTNTSRVRELLDARSFTEDISSNELRGALDLGLSLADNFDAITECEVIVVCVPTPLDDGNDRPNLSSVLSSMDEIARRIRPGALVILESTVAPGTTEGPVLSLFVDKGKKLDKDFYLAYSPERINPGSSEYNFQEIPKIVSGCGSESLRRATDFYNVLVDEVVPVSGTREAEFAKLLENTYRLVNVSLVNELAFAAHRMGIDFHEVTRAAATKPYGFQSFVASSGAGGHCIPVDPVYLANEISLSNSGPTAVLDSALNVNRSVPGRIIEEVLAAEHPLGGKKILVAGLAYKPGIADTRNSPALSVIEELRKRQAIVEVTDELVEELMVGSETFRSIELETVQNEFDIVILLHPPRERLVQLLRPMAGKIFTTSGRFGEI